jgi:chorismate mutase
MVMEELKQLRKKIDEVDDQFLQLLSQRTQICRSIGVTKKALDLPVQDARREQEVYQQVKEKAVKLGLNPVRVEAVYREIVNMCSAVQE